MMTRCFDSKHENYHYYGGRGITVCVRWQTFTNFLQDMGIVPEGYWLDRKDTNGDYEPGNCRWLSASRSQRNKRESVFVICLGVRTPLMEAADITGIEYGTLKAWHRRNPAFPGDMSQLYFVPWRNRRKLIWNSAGF